MATSQRGENGVLDIPDSRSQSDFNLIVILCQKVANSELIHMEYLSIYIDEVLTIFLKITFAVTSFLTLFFVILGISLFKFEVINPVNELIDHITSPQNYEKIERFVKKIQKREIDFDFKQADIIAKKEKIRSK